MIVRTKRGDMKVVVDHEQNSKEFYLKAVTDNGKKMGSLTFTIETDRNQSWLNVVETEPNFKRQGVASGLITAMEYISIKKFHISQIVGTFMPYIKTRRNPFKPTNKLKVEKFTKAFYNKNGYDVNLYTSVLKKPLTKKAKDYEQIVDCSYQEFMSFAIDFESMEEWQR